MKTTKRTTQIFSLSHGGLILGLVTQQLPLPSNSGLMQLLVACRVANLAFLKPNFEIQAFLTHLAFFQNQKYLSKSDFFFFNFFGLKDLALAKHWLSELHLHCKSLLTKVYDHARCKEHCKDFIDVLKICNAFNKKQMYDNVFTRKQTAYKNLNCTLQMFLTSFNI